MTESAWQTVRWGIPFGGEWDTYLSRLMGMKNFFSCYEATPVKGGKLRVDITESMEASAARVPCMVDVEPMDMMGCRLLGVFVHEIPDEAMAHLQALKATWTWSKAFVRPHGTIDNVHYFCIYVKKEQDCIYVTFDFDTTAEELELVD